MFVVAAFYKFVNLEDVDSIRQHLLEVCQSGGLKGTILLAEEGINSTISGTREGIDKLLETLRAYPEFADIEHKESFCDYLPFARLKVKIKPEIVTFDPSANPNIATGQYLEAQDWNRLLEQEDVIVIDTRNHYEFVAGTFENAIDPMTDRFTQFKDFIAQAPQEDKTKPVAIFCTGGIRCEKASSYLLQQGFEQVYQLKGGILKYMADIPEAESKFVGECFIFDERRALTHELDPSPSPVDISAQPITAGT